MGILAFDTRNSHTKCVATSSLSNLIKSAIFFGIFSAAFAAAVPTFANVVGSDTQNFNPTTSGLDFVTVHSSETLKPGILNFGLYLNYAVNTLPYRDATTTQSRVDFNDSLLGADFNLGVGLGRHWDAGISFPQILSQSVDSTTAARGQFAENGLTEVRVNTKYRVHGGDDGGVALVLSANFNQIGDNPYTGSEAGPTTNFEIVGDKQFGAYTLGANVGYRFRNPGTPLAGIGIAPIDDQFIYSVAGNYLLESHDTKIIAEIFGSIPTQSDTSEIERSQKSLEALIGLKHDLNANLAAHVGGGSELMHGNASPDWRVYAGLNYTIGPIFSKENPVRGEDADPFSGTPTKPIETFVVSDVLFKFDSDEIQEGSRDTLDKLAAYLKKPPYFKQLDIGGHTDSIGAAVYNLDLSQRRARNVKRYLVERADVPSDRVASFGYGEGVPIADNGNYQGRALNRRVEFKITRDFSEGGGAPPAPVKLIDVKADVKSKKPSKKAPTR